MLETVNLDVEKLSKAEYKPVYDELIEKLVVLQQKARLAKVGLVVLFEGWDGAGKGSRISDLMYNLDARSTSVHVTADFDAEEAKLFVEKDQGVRGFYPLMQEFWRALGGRGDVTFFDRGWYTTMLMRLFSVDFEGDLKKVTREGLKEGKVAKAIDRWLSSIEAFERQLTDDGYVVVKFFMHVSKDAQEKRLTKLYEDPDTRWRVKKSKLKNIERYDQFYRLYDRLLEGSDFDFAPWTLINGEDKRRANLDVAAALVEAFEVALSRTPDAEAAEAAAKAQKNSASQGVAAHASDPRTRTAEEDALVREAAKREAAEAARLAPKKSRFKMIEHPPTLAETDHTLFLPEKLYRERIKEEQKRFADLECRMYQARVPLMVMYEGWDAAGKGGNIKRLAQALDARAYTIYPSPAPTAPELAHPHLWRYWTRLPKAGHVGFYDRSWYGRVLVERVEGFASPTEWARAYDEINEFERDLERWGAILIKFWVDVSPDVQLLRFAEREADPAKQWKITDEDWRNRDKNPQYYAAVEDMFRLTSTPYAPWIVLPGDDKRYARVRALEVVNDALEKRLG